MADQWFYQMLGQEFGPVEFSELLSLRDAGQLAASDTVRRNSETACMSLQEALQANGGAVAVAETLDKDLNIDDFVIEKQDTNIDDFVIERRDTNIDDPVIEKRDKTARQEEVRFYVRSNGTTIGPLAADDFCRLADAGKIDAGDEVRCDDGEWQNASEFPEVMAAQMFSVAPKSVPDASEAKPPAKKRRPRGQKRKPKKRRPKVDDELQGVFDEVFGPEGSLKQQEPGNNTPASKPVVTSTSNDSTEIASSATDTAPEMPTTHAMPGASAMAAASASAFPTTPPRQQPARAWTPPPKRKQKLSERFDFDSRTLGIAGAIIGVIVLGCLIPFIELDSFFGATVPSSASVEKTLNDYIVQFESAKTSDTEWQSFATEVRSTVGGIIKDYREASGLCQARDLELKQAATCVVQLANCRRDDTDKHAALVAQFRKSVSGKG